MTDGLISPRPGDSIEDLRGEEKTSGVLTGYTSVPHHRRGLGHELAIFSCHPHNIAVGLESTPYAPRDHSFFGAERHLSLCGDLRQFPPSLAPD